MNDAPIRIAQVVGMMNGGGVETVVMNYYQHIDRSKYQFDFFYSSGSSMVPVDEIRALGGGLFKLPSYKALPLYMKAAETAFRNGRYEIVHSHVNALSAFPLAAAKKAGVPIRVAHAHSASGRGEYVKNAAKALLKLAANKYPTHKLACSELAGDWLFGASAGYDILFNAIELEKFAFSNEIRDSVRSELGIPEGTFLVGHIGRFMQQKNHEFLIDVFEQILMKEPNSMLALAGDGGLRRNIEKKVADAGIGDNVLFLGYRDDADKLYQAFDTFILPSLYEGLCLVGVEAQRSGLPCLFSDEITREVLLTGNARMLSLGDSAEKWASEALSFRERVPVDTAAFANYDISVAAKRLEGLYDEMLNSSVWGR